MSELSPKELAEEFNRRKWREREDWKPMQMPDYGASPFDRPCIAIFSDGVTYEPRTRIQIEDARALVAGWQAEEELAALKARLAHVEHEWRELHISNTDFIQTQQAEVATLTAEVERLKAKTDDLTRLLDDSRSVSRERYERLREPAAEGVEVEKTMAERMAERDLSVTRSLIAAAELHKGIEPAKGSWGWALAQMKAGKRVRRPHYLDGRCVWLTSEEPRVFRYNGAFGQEWTNFPDDFEAQDWQVEAV